ncbi:MAG: prepilin-type N-terminal cleavage/methylation domain-containing protein [Planctomycetes bacterium]|nr:prepilin-type N-terminal cleavage/methylation domain-containing protein [Planctomycetota bacterium]
MMTHRNRLRGFSLVELVIVVVIIGVIAAIAVPRISRGAKGAGDASLRGSLAGLRNAIDMYAAEHGGTFPAGADQTAIEDKLTKMTDASGNVGTTAGVHIYGPYLRGGFPPAPVGANKGKKTIKIVTGDPTATAATEATGEGWIYSTDTGKVIINTIATDDSSPAVAYSSY